MNLPKPPVDLDIWLDKISLLHQNLARDPNPLDADLLKRYVRSYYEALLAWERGEDRAGGGPVGMREAMAELRQVPPLAPFGPSAEGRAPAAPPTAPPPPAHTAPPAPAEPPSPDVVPPLPAAPAPTAPAPAPTPTPTPAPPVPAPTPAPAPPAPPAPAAEEPPAPAPAEAPSPEPPPAPAGAEPPASGRTAPEASPSPAADEPEAADEPSLNDRFARPDAPRPLHAAAATPAEDLRRIIDINERALFTRELFGGNSEAYGSAVRALNDFPGLAQAEAYIDRELAPRFSWPASNRVVDHFRDLVRQRYGA